MRLTLPIYAIFCFLCFTACKNSKTEEETSDNSAYTNAYSYNTVKNITTKKAAVVTAHPLASEIGKSILEQGGNAIDASIAVQYALAVVYPVAGNIGGGGFMVVHTANGESHSIDFRETAPAAAHKDMYLDENGDAIAAKSLDGHLAPGVPGTVAGIYLAHKKFGKLSMDKLIKPAIKLAEHGFVITQQEADGLNKHADAFVNLNTVPNAFSKNTAWKSGDTLVQKDLSNTLKRIKKQGQAGFYEGETARLIIEEMQRGGGIITLEDLKNYKPVIREPRVFSYKDKKIVSMDLPSSGGLMLQQMLKMLEPYDLKGMGFQSAEAIHHIVEVERRAYADRTEYMGDPDFVDVPVEALLNTEYITNRMKDFEPGKAGNSKDIHPGLEESEETTHFSIIDEEGNAVAVTTTINTDYGSRVVVGGAGFLLNNEMDDFSAKPGAPNAFGLLGTDANAIEPNKRMVSSMMPTIVLDNNRPYMVVGTPGGSTIITSVLQSILNIMEFELTPEEAVNTPKFHHQWKPDVIYIEDDFPSNIAYQLEEMGYTIEKRSPIGRTELILIDEKGIHAIADKRGDDSASGY